MGKFYELFQLSYKGSEPQYKSINYPVIPKYLSLEDHIEKPQSQLLQQMIEEKRSRELVEIHGITLERTKQFYAEKIQEYNDLIDLKHIQKQRSSSQNGESKNDNLIRFPGDEGKITNFHISVNSHNLNPLFNEINRRAKSERVESIAPQKRKHNQTSIQNSQHTLTSKANQPMHSGQKNNLTTKTRLEESLDQYDNQHLLFMKNPMIENKGEYKSIIKQQHKSASFRIQFTRKSSVKKQSRVPQYKSEPHKIDLSSIINESFRQLSYQNQKNVPLEEESFCEQAEVNINDLDLTQIVQPSLKIQQQYVLTSEQSQFLPDIYKDVQLEQSINLQERKKTLDRRKSIISDFLQKKQPQFLHICGSKFPVVNNNQNWNNYNKLRARILEKQLQDELIKLRNDKLKNEEIYDLSTLQGPPQGIKYQSSNLRQDYDDVKMTKILKQFVQSRDV